jgi:hypothetical protein
MQYALLDASQDFMVTALVLVSGVVTDRIPVYTMHPQAIVRALKKISGAIVYGNIMYTIGSMLIAAANDHPLIQVHNRWRGRPVLRRYRYLNRPVQDFL